MKWYKIILDFENPIFVDAIGFINYLSKLIYLGYKLDNNKIGIFSKISEHNTYTVYFSEAALWKS